MNRLLRNIVLASVCLIAISAHADDAIPNDTVYFYDTWSQIFNGTPSAMLVNPYIEPYTPYEVGILTDDEDTDVHIAKTHMVASLGDSIMLVSAEFLKEHFSGDVRKMHEYAPIIYNGKAAFAMYVGYGQNLSFKTIMFDEEVDYRDIVDYYYFDFMNRKVLKVTPEVLSTLLEDYHDLQMRYEGMKDYKKRSVMEYFIFEFLDRINQDPMKPFIPDITD